MAIIEPDLYPRLQQLGLPMRVIGRDPRRIIVSNRLTPATAATPAPAAADSAK
jgi:hypothetical protein